MKITSDHLARGAFIYIRQSTVDQLANNQVKVAIARKIAVILHCIWVDGTSFDWGHAKPV